MSVCFKGTSNWEDYKKYTTQLYITQIREAFSNGVSAFVWYQQSGLRAYFCKLRLLNQCFVQANFHTALCVQINWPISLNTKAKYQNLDMSNFWNQRFWTCRSTSQIPCWLYSVVTLEWCSGGYLLLGEHTFYCQVTFSVISYCNTTIVQWKVTLKSLQFCYILVHELFQEWSC